MNDDKPTVIPLPRSVEIDPPDDLAMRVKTLEVEVRALSDALSRHVARHTEELSDD